MNEYKPWINPKTGRGWRWIGELRETSISNGYVLIHIPNHPNCDLNGCVREHRLIMEEQIGRYLLPDEHVHHKDRNTLNNDPDNLELLTKSEHARLHKAEWSKNMWKTVTRIRERPKNPNMARKKKKTKTIIITTRRKDNS